MNDAASNTGNHAARADLPKTVARDSRGREVIARHTIITRITHWLNAIAIVVLLMSGMQIFNAHPRLYWGPFGADADAPFIEVTSVDSNKDGLMGQVRIAGHAINTTGFMGVSGDADNLMERGFPSWATIPSFQDLSAGRRWHLFFAWVLVINGTLYLLSNLLNGHLRRDILPRREELSPGHIVHEVAEHARFRWPKGDADKTYNILQKLTYLSVIVGAIPMMVATGLTMSPGFNAIAPWLLELLGGRQSARTLHFISASYLVGFIFVHVVLVLLAGPWNLMRSMITGRYTVKPETAA
jgi:thiosulfate reductase cytochrome b subunit